MEDRETTRIRKHGESKTTRIMMATVPHVTSGSRLKKISGRWIFVRQSVQNLQTLHPWPELFWNLLIKKAVFLSMMQNWLII